MINSKNFYRLLASLLLLISINTKADINVFTCEPEWASLIQALGGDKVSVFSATTGKQDPHQVQARPSLISKMRDAQLLVCSGADLEVGWLPLLLRRAGNSSLQSGKPGYFFAADHVRLLGIPKSIDRSQGDVHAAGNPHVHTSPKNIRLIAKALVKRMKEIDPANADYYQTRTNDFLGKWKLSMAKWKAQIEKIQNTKIVVQHAGWEYFNQYLKLEQVATIEQKPGIPVTSSHLSALLTQLKQQPAELIIRAAYQNGRSSKWLSERSGIPAVALPFTVGGTEQAKDLFSLFDHSIALLIENISSKVD
jgi:zinc/manganese transport system substrate-binding protein